jgi:hypothetical protein
MVFFVLMIWHYLTKIQASISWTIIAIFTLHIISAFFSFWLSFYSPYNTSLVKFNFVSVLTKQNLSRDHNYAWWSHFILFYYYHYFGDTEIWSQGLHLLERHSSTWAMPHAFWF